MYLRRAEILDSQETGTGTLEVHSRYVWNKRGGEETPGFWPRQMSSPGENQRALYPRWQGKRREGSVESELFGPAMTFGSNTTFLGIHLPAELPGKLELTDTG